MESFATIVTSEKPLTIVTKLYLSDVFEDPGRNYENNILNWTKICIERHMGQGIQKWTK